MINKELVFKIIINFEFSIFAILQYIAVIILFDAKNFPSLASRTLQLAPGPGLKKKKSIQFTWLCQVLVVLQWGLQL